MYMKETIYKEEEWEEGESFVIKNGKKSWEVKVRVITSIKFRNLPL